jgi:hypothetical protein
MIGGRTCECMPPRPLYVSMAAPDWWSCAWCDGRAAPKTNRYYSAGPCGNIPSEPARPAHHKARRSEQARLAIRPCAETDDA